MAELLDGGILAIDSRAVAAEPDHLIEAGMDVRAEDIGTGANGPKVIAIAFPKFTDGRGYSSAAILREAGYDGDIRAVGDVTIDQLWYLKRVGFSSLAPLKPISADAAESALKRFPTAYQDANDGAGPAWRLRSAKGQ